MKNILILVGLFICFNTNAQNNSSDFGISISDDELVNVNFNDQLIVDSIDNFKINFADKSALIKSGLFNAFEADSIIRYRNKYGYFYAIEEMQVLGVIDINRLEILKSIMSFDLPVMLSKIIDLKNLEGRIVSRFIFPVSKNDKSDLEHYSGKNIREAISLKIQLGDKVNFVFNAEKDGGEQFQFTKKVKGFDYNSAHITVKNIRNINKFVLGDYQIQLGQGLVIWQGMSLGKTSDIITIRKQECGIKEYNGMSEFGFFRGAAMEYNIKKIKFTNWISIKKQDATVYTDSVIGNYIQSIKTDGYHRTDLELAHKNVVQQIVFGNGCSILFKNVTIGLNTVYTANNITMKSNGVLYNFYGFEGNNNFNQSISYTGTKRNFNYFGEVAIDQHFSPSIINGIIASIEKNISVSLLHRYYSTSYYSFHSNGFGENNRVTNEKGFYFGANYNFNKKIQLSGYYDIYSFPWLKYQMNVPSYGSDYTLQFSYTPNKLTNISLRYHQEKNQQEVVGIDNHSKDIIASSSRTLRLQMRTVFSRLQITTRFDWNYISQQGGEDGILVYLDLQYKPMLKPYSFSIRASLYQTDSYSSRVYSYQNDLPGSYNLGSFSGSGESIYAMVTYKVNRKIQFWLRGSRSLNYLQVTDNKQYYPDYEIKFQVAYQFLSVK